MFGVYEITNFSPTEARHTCCKRNWPQNDHDIRFLSRQVELVLCHVELPEMRRLLVAHHVVALQPGEPAGAREFATFEAGMHYVEETYLKASSASEPLRAACCASVQTAKFCLIAGRMSLLILQVAAGLGLCEAELSSCSVIDVLRGQHAALGAVSSSVVGGGDPTAADLPAAALARFVKVHNLPWSGMEADSYASKPGIG